MYEIIQIFVSHFLQFMPYFNVRVREASDTDGDGG